MNIYINGRFLTQRITGVQRYAVEVVKAMDNMLDQPEYAKDRRFVILCPQNIQYTLPLKHMEIRKVGRFKGHLWEQTELPFYARKGTLLSFCNCAPILKRDQFVTIHDAAVKAFPVTFSFAFRTWYSIMFYCLGKMARGIFTVSEFSKKELNRYFSIPLDKMTITYNGADHIRKLVPDERIIEKYDLQNKQYVFAVSSVNPSKNFQLVLHAAEKMPDLTFIIAGGANKNVFSTPDFHVPDNAKFIGYVTDEELVALYSHAACFVYPSLYEGFGIPPIEAMSFGCPVVASDRASLPEGCRDAALYCDANDVDGFVSNIIQVIQDKETQGKLSYNADKLVQCYSWKVPAQTIMSQLEMNIRLGK